MYRAEFRYDYGSERYVMEFGNYENMFNFIMINYPYVVKINDLLFASTDGEIEILIWEVK